MEDKYEFPDEIEEKQAARAEEKPAASDDFEVEIVDDTPVQDRGRKPLDREVADPSDDEMDNYTEGVKKQLQPKVVDLSGLMAHLSSHELGDLCSHRDALQGLRRHYQLAASAEADTIIMAAKHEFSSREHRSRI